MPAAPAAAASLPPEAAAAAAAAAEAALGPVPDEPDGTSRFTPIGCIATRAPEPAAAPEAEEEAALPTRTVPPLPLPIWRDMSSGEPPRAKNGDPAPEPGVEPAALPGPEALRCVGEGWP
jgi:hypothetical protein